MLFRSDNIFYDFDRATLKPESATALNELITLLNDNPNVSIELSAHTDMIGTDTYNENLSGRRAQSVVDYLIKGGIEKERLQAKGYGKGAPKVVSEKLNELYSFLPVEQVLDPVFIETLPDEEKDICNQLNRRTEFQVLSITYGLE